MNKLKIPWKRFKFDQKYLMKLKSNFEEIDFDKIEVGIFDFEESAQNVFDYYLKM